MSALLGGTQLASAHRGQPVARVVHSEAATQPLACVLHVHSRTARGGTLQTAAVAGIAEDLKHTATPKEQPVGMREPEEAKFNWFKTWYPMAGAADLDPAVPHPIMLLGKRMVLWRDSQQIWRALDDSCPHRRVPLSEGRIEPTDGNLQCCYHGWRFNGQGQCVAIPALQHLDERAQNHACSSSQACVPSFPVREEHGMLWVWPDEGKNSGAESDAASVPWPESLANLPDNKVTVKSFDNYSRDLYGAFDVWLENMTDQSHVAYAHHGAAGNREGEKAGFFRMEPVRNISSNPSEGFTFSFDWSGNSKSISKGTSLQYKPPCLCSFQTGKDSGVVLWIYAVPTSSTTTRIMINSVLIKDRDNKGPKLSDVSSLGIVKFLSTLGFTTAMKVLPRWPLHLTLNAVNDGDLVFMHRQSQWLRQTEGGKHPGEHYYLPGENDRGVTALRKWLNRQGGGGPRYAGAAGDTPPEVFQQLDRRVLLDRETQHTKNCKSCSQALETTRNVRKAMLVSAGASTLALATIIGAQHGLTPSPGLLTAVATTSMAGAAFAVLGKLQAKFQFTDWDNRYT